MRIYVYVSLFLFLSSLCYPGVWVVDCADPIPMIPHPSNKSHVGYSVSYRYCLPVNGSYHSDSGWIHGLCHSKLIHPSTEPAGHRTQNLPTSSNQKKKEKKSNKKENKKKLTFLQRETERYGSSSLSSQGFRLRHALFCSCLALWDENAVTYCILERTSFNTWHKRQLARSAKLSSPLIAQQGGLIQEPMLAAHLSCVPVMRAYIQLAIIARAVLYGALRTLVMVMDGAEDTRIAGWRLIYSGVYEPVGEIFDLGGCMCWK
jgi:hypothetical protein